MGHLFHQIAASCRPSYVHDECRQDSWQLSDGKAQLLSRMSTCIVLWGGVGAEHQACRRLGAGRDDDRTRRHHWVRSLTRRLHTPCEFSTTFKLVI